MLRPPIWKLIDLLEISSSKLWRGKFTLNLKSFRFIWTTLNCCFLETTNAILRWAATRENANFVRTFRETLRIFDAQDFLLKSALLQWCPLALYQSLVVWFFNFHSRIRLHFRFLAQSIGIKAFDDLPPRCRLVSTRRVQGAPIGHNRNQNLRIRWIFIPEIGSIPIGKCKRSKMED